MFFQRFLRMKEILLLLNNKIKKIENKVNKKVCVVGVSPNVGVTHLCISLANFMHSALGKNVIYIELSNESQLLSVVGMKQILIGDILAYEYKGVRYILSNDIDAIRDIMLRENAWFVVDMANLNEETRPIFNNCNNRIIIGSLRPWCQREYYEFIDKLGLLEYDTDQMTYIKTDKNKKTNIIASGLANYTKSTIKDLPIINDPFSLKEENFQELMDLIR